MKNLAITTTLGLLVQAALAQGCFETDLGKSLGNAQDMIYPIEPIGFPFVLDTATYTHIHVSDHCITWLSNNGVPAPPPATPLVYLPTQSSLVANGPVIAPLWSDIIAGLSGEVFINSTPTQCTVTWKDVINLGYPTPTFTVQMRLYPSGVVEFRYSANATNNSSWGGVSDNGIIAISPGAPAVLPSAVDMSASPTTTNPTIFEAFLLPEAFDVDNSGLDLIPTFPGYTVMPPLGPPANCASSSSYGAGCGGLALVSNAPSMGGTWDLTTTGIDAVSPIAIVFLSTSQQTPPVPLTTLGLPAPGCELHLGAPVLGSLSGANVGGVASVMLPIPSVAGLAGAMVRAQSLCLTMSNAANLLTSNGNGGTIDAN
jgi:hypothetical protein